MPYKTKVLIVDDSALMRAMLTQIINSAADLEVVGAVGDALAAREAIKSLNPDVLTLDIEMPKMDGLDFLDRVMKLRPMPVVMISSLTERGSDVTLKALELGAVDFIPKPKVNPGSGLQESTEIICEKIRMAAKAQLAKRSAPRDVRPVSEAKIKSGLADVAPNLTRESLILIGASTGGTEAIKAVLMQLPKQVPGILIVQHMPEMFTGSFAQRLNGLCDIEVKEAEHGETVRPGTAYIAPGHSHLLVKRIGTHFICELSDAAPVMRHRPSVDILFRSAVENRLASRVCAALLTGMGKDGAQGMLELKNAGAYTVAQDQESCVVWGMPREATQIGATCEIATLNDVAGCLLQNLGRRVTEQSR